MSVASTPSRRVGLYGGSFDPVHAAHLALARTAVSQLGLDELRWLPTGSPWHKRAPVASAQDRLAMLRLVVDGEPKHVVDDRELRRPGPTYTIDTLESLANEQPGAAWFLVIGQDQLAKITTWHRWTEVVARVTLAVAGREGHEPTVGDALAAARPRVHSLRMLPMAESSTAVRQALMGGAGGEHLASMVPSVVLRYIDQHGLYRSTSKTHVGLEPPRS